MRRSFHLTPAALAWRGLFTRPGRTLLSLLGIALGVAAVLATGITNRNVAVTLEGLFERTLGGAELAILPLGKETSVGEGVLDTVQRMPGVSVAAPAVRSVTVLAGTLGADQPVTDANGNIEMGKSVLVEGIDVRLDPQMRVYALAEGRFPQPGAREALITHTLAEQNDLALGDVVRLFSPSEIRGAESGGERGAPVWAFSRTFPPGGQATGASSFGEPSLRWGSLEAGEGGVHKLKITGILRDEGAAMLHGGRVVFAPLEVVQQIFSMEDGYSEISVRLEGGAGSDPQALAAMKAALESRLRQSARVTYPAARADQVPRMASSYQFALAFFSVVALFMGAFLIYNTFATTVLERTQEIGLLRAIGMQRRQVMKQVLTEAALLAVLGCIVGAGAGVFLANGLMSLMRSFFQVEAPSIAFTLGDVLKSTGIGLAGTLLATLLPARQAARTTPVEALAVHSRSGQRVRPVVWMSGFALLGASWMVLNQPAAGSHQWMLVVRLGAFAATLLGAVLTVPLAVTALEPVTRRLARIYGEMGSLGARNVNRSATRTMVTVASLAVSLVMIIEVDSIVFVLKRDVSDWLDNALGADLLVRAPYPMRQSFARSLESVPGVLAASPSRTIEVQVAAAGAGGAWADGEVVYFTAIDAQQFRRVGGKDLIAGQGDSEAAWAVFEQGKALFVSSVVADEYGLEQGGRVVLRTQRGRQEFTIAGLTTEFDQNGMVVTGSYADLKRLSGESGADLFTVKAAEGFDVKAVGEAVSARFEAREGIQVLATQTFKQGVMAFYNRLTSLFNVLGLVGVMIGTLGLVNTMTMNILERRRELGMLRAVGCLRRQVVYMVLAEALITGVVSALYGMVFGYLLSRSLVVTANLISGYDLQYAFSARPYLVSLAIALLVSQLATFAPARTASRVNIIQALKHE